MRGLLHRTKWTLSTLTDVKRQEDKTTRRQDDKKTRRQEDNGASPSSPRAIDRALDARRQSTHHYPAPSAVHLMLDDSRPVGCARGPHNTRAPRVATAVARCTRARTSHPRPPIHRRRPRNSCCTISYAFAREGGALGYIRYFMCWITHCAEHLLRGVIRRSGCARHLGHPCHVHFIDESRVRAGCRQADVRAPGEKQPQTLAARRLENRQQARRRRCVRRASLEVSVDARAGRQQKMHRRHIVTPGGAPQGRRRVVGVEITFRQTIGAGRAPASSSSATQDAVPTIAADCSAVVSSSAFSTSAPAASNCATTRA